MSSTAITPGRWRFILGEQARRYGTMWLLSAGPLLGSREQPAMRAHLTGTGPSPGAHFADVQVGPYAMAGTAT